MLHSFRPRHRVDIERKVGGQTKRNVGNGSDQFFDANRRHLVTLNKKKKRVQRKSRKMPKTEANNKINAQ